MRAFVSLNLRVTRFGAWRVMLGLLLAAALGSVGAWAASMRPWAGQGFGGGVGVGIGVLAAAAAASLLRLRGFALGFDGEQWQLSPTQGPEARVFGQLLAALDLGGWLLLRFEPNSPVPGRRVVWLPLQRAGLEADWHALRCAVYSARPAGQPLFPSRG